MVVVWVWICLFRLGFVVVICLVDRLDWFFDLCLVMCLLLMFGLRGRGWWGVFLTLSFCEFA